MVESLGKKLVVANLKMNLITVRERDRWVQSFREIFRTAKFRRTDVVVCPPSVYLEVFGKNLSKVAVMGAQNIFWERRGSFTGETSPAVARELGCRFAIIGHSERRGILGETDDMVAKKVFAALETGLTPIVCVGETESDRRQEKTAEVIARQITKAFSDVSAARGGEIVVAYEPVWAVGSDRTPSTNEILEARTIIKRTLRDLFSGGVDAVRILYGGSVHPTTTDELCNQTQMDGALVGRESLDAKAFEKIVSIIDDGE